MPATPPEYDAVIVGSGFGGSITALRLAEAGKSVLVLERGRRWEPETFPRDVTRVRDLFWRYPERPASRGLYELHVLSGVAAVTASGLGGGSLVYANIHIRPDPVVFEDPAWPEELDREELEPYYDRVADLLGVSPLPENLEIPKRDRFRRAAEKTGHEVFDPDQAVSWSGCDLIAQCEFGCPLGAKNTLDRTVLPRAEKLGARIRTGCWVHGLAPAGDGYEVRFREIESGKQRSIHGRRVVLSAGTLGTAEILHRAARSREMLPRLSKRLGHGFSANGDFLASIQETREDVEPGLGPDVTSVIRYFEEEPRFTMAAPTFHMPVMRVLASLGQPSGSLLRPLAPVLWPRLDDIVPWAFERGLLSRPSRLPMPHAGNPEHLTFLFGIGRDDAGGEVGLRNGKLDVEWNYADANRELVASMLEAMEELNEAVYGGSMAPVVTWSGFRRPLSVHPLGGCALGESREDGVVSPDGEVYGYPGLFVADGSVIPSSIGFHPAMTIAAVSARIADAVEASYPS